MKKMMKKKMGKKGLYLSLVTIIIAMTVCLSMIVIPCSKTVVFDNNIEALASEEVDMEKLKELLNQEIWRYAIVAWQVGEYLIYCETAGCLQCPVPGLT